MQHLASLVVVIIATTGLALAQAKPYPKPQIVSAAGTIAPDFTLKDQNGKEVQTVWPARALGVCSSIVVIGDRIA